MAPMSFAVAFKYAAMVALIGFSLAALSDGCTYKGDCEESQVCCDGECFYGSSCVGQYCSSDTDCSSGESCCRQSCVSSSSCVGQYCSSDSDCSSGESCCRSSCVSSSSCVGQYCSSDSDCSSGESCCRSSCVSSSSCVGQYCSFDYDCSSGQSCCSNQCHDSSDCFGFSCSFSSDCGSWETCCHGTCQNVYDNCVDIAAAVIASSVIGSVAFICTISMCIFYARRRGRTIQGRVLLGRSVTATTATTTRYQGQAPSSYSYQQGHPYYPLPQSEQQQQTANLPPYNPGTMAGSEQPPPYPTEPHRASGGVYSPKPFYGTINH